MRIVFMGTPDFSVPSLSALIAQGHEIVAVYTRAPKAAGRGMAERRSPVHELADSFGLPVHTPKSLRNTQAAEVFASHNADVAIVVAYGLLLPKAILDAPAFGCLNLHGSLLPRWRGAAPIQRALMAGDAETGVMVMQMDEGLDTGAIGLAERIPLPETMSAGELHDIMASIGADLLVRALSALERGTLHFTPQSLTGALYAQKIDKAESRIDWKQPAQKLHDHIRGLSPFPGAFFEGDFGRGLERVKVLRAEVAEGAGSPGEVLQGLTIACGQDALHVLNVQRAGKGAVSAEEFLRGTPVPIGMVMA
jgi:methionyl-tRNA formyltransferase